MVPLRNSPQEMTAHAHGKDDDDNNQSDKTVAHFWVHDLDPFLLGGARGRGRTH